MFTTRYMHLRWTQYTTINNHWPSIRLYNSAHSLHLSSYLTITNKLAAATLATVLLLDFYTPFSYIAVLRGVLKTLGMGRPEEKTTFGILSLAMDHSA